MTIERDELGFDAPAPLVCRCEGGEGRKIAFALSVKIGRPVLAQPTAGEAYYLVAPRSFGPPTGSTLLASSWRYSLWWTEPR